MLNRSLIIFASLVLVACSSGSSNSELLTAAASTSAVYQVINLENGSINSAASIPDLQSNPKYRSSHMVFRLIPAGSGLFGTDSESFAAQVDAPQHREDMPKYYCAVFEITQAQWAYLSDSRPWQDLIWSAGSDPVSTEAGTLPAYGLCIETIDNALTTWRQQNSRHLTLPNDLQWEYACRAGSTRLYHWGDSLQNSDVATYAAVFETTTDNPGPQTVGARQSNAYGLFDTHGNCWEVTSDGHLRGGSWHDPVSLARAAVTSDIDPDTPHALVGARLLYLP